MRYDFLISFACIMLVGLVISLVLTPLCARLARRIGMVDNPGQRKIHSVAIPYGGGLAIFFSLLFTGSISLMLIFLARDYGNTDFSNLVLRYVPTSMGPEGYEKIIGVGIGALLIFLTGLVDDLRPLPAWVKLLCQAVAAALAWYFGVRITLFVDSQVFSFIITMCWLILITNSFNLLDNMDGLSSGVALLCGLHLLLLSAFGGHFFQPAMLAVFCGAVAGFLFYNFSPARLFMGDSGSLLLGYLLAIFAAAGTYAEDYSKAHALLVPLLVMGVALFDSLSVIVIRLRAGMPIYHGDTNHLSHRLCRMGFTRRQAVLLIYLLGMIFGQCALLIRNLDATDSSAVFLICLMIVILMASLMAAGNKKTR